jgi:hypothetical protein
LSDPGFRSPLTPKFVEEEYSKREEEEDLLYGLYQLLFLGLYLLPRLP